MDRFCFSIDYEAEAFVAKKTHTHTHYQFVVTIRIRVACSFYKFAYGVEYLHHNELFEIGKSIVHVVLWEFVFAINVVCKNKNTLA